jgi:putative ABC transport system substrate-binding protein
MAIGIGRRQFITALSGAAVAWPGSSRAQQPIMPVVGFINGGSARAFSRPLSAFLKGLREAGYVEGRNVKIEYRWAEDHNDRLPAMTADLVHLQVAVIVTTSVQTALAAKASTTTIPIVFETAADPVKLGLVGSLNRPGGTITGVTQLGEDVFPKRLELLHELLPSARVIALLVNPTNPALAEPQTRMAMSAAKILGLELHVLTASADGDFDAVFAKIVELRAGGLVIGSDTLFTTHNDQLAALTVYHGVPAIYERREFAAAGGLMGYGSDIMQSYGLAGTYTGRILKGEKPADLPVQQATKVELFINLKTAKTLGISIPLSLLGRADEVIE